MPEWSTIEGLMKIDLPDGGEIPKFTKKWPHPGQRVSFTFRQLATSHDVDGGKLLRNTIQTQRDKPY